MTSIAENHLRLVPSRRWRTLIAAGLLSAALAGCSSTAPDLEADAAEKLQAKVLTVSQSAAGNDTSGALKSLDELVAQLDASAAEGRMSFKRHQSIMTAVQAVRADLTAAQAAAKAQADAEAAAAAKAAADAAAAEAAKAAPAPAVEVPAPSQVVPGKGEKGKGASGR